MTPEIIMVISILVGAVILFVTEIVRLDLTALIVLVALVFSGLVQPEQALSGFSNPAVVTVWAMFILSTGLTRTGISSIIGVTLLRFAKKGGGKLVAVLMTATALLSALMNNTGVAAMFLPITMEIAKRTKQPPSRLLLPMAQGCLLGGLILLIGTASNLVVRDAMRDAGYAPLGIFDFAPGGLIILFISVIYMGVFGWRYLPIRQTSQNISYMNDQNGETGLSQYELEERFALLKIPQGSLLHGKSLQESRIGRALGLNILNIKRNDQGVISAEPNAILENGDQLLTLGRLERIREISQSPTFTVENDRHVLEHLVEGDVGLAEFEVATDSTLIEKTLTDLDFRNHYHVNVLAIRQQDIIRRTNLQDIRLEPGNIVVIQGTTVDLKHFENFPHFRRLNLKEMEDYHLEDRLLTIQIPVNSSFVGHTLSETRLGEAYGLAVLSINRDNDHWKIAEAGTMLEPGDLLLVGGKPIDIDVVKGLSTLEIEEKVKIDLSSLEEGPLQIVEVMLSPYSRFAGKTLRDINFREKFGVSVLAIWRGDRSFRSNLGNIPLNYGDALLCYGEQVRFKTLASERDFVVLSMEAQEKPRFNKAPMAAIIMVGVILSAILLEVPIAIAAITGSILMVISGALSMDEAYQGIEWKSIFLIAAMLPLGIAMQETGAASFLGNLVVQSLGTYGPSAILAGLMLLSMISTQVMPSPVVAVIMSPIALTAALNLNISPYAFILGIAYALAASFLSPVAHPANLLVMSPGGYRFTDYVKHGLPLSLTVLGVSIIILPILFPF